MAEERLQKILSRAGVASRRAAEELIRAGRVQVNGEVVRELGTRADPRRDVIRVDDRTIAEPGELVYYVLYKPERVVTTLSDPEGRDAVGDFIRRLRERVYPVGRLDYDAEGVLLLTNDGELAHKLTHPRWGVPRTYLAKVKGEPTDEVLERMRQGVRLEDGMARALEASFEKRTPKNTWIRLVVAEGRHHLVKRLCEAVGHPVVRLFRSDYAGVTAAGLRPGEVRELTSREVQMLKKAVEKEAPPPPGGRRRKPARAGAGAVRNPVLGTARRQMGQGRRAPGRSAPEERPPFGSEFEEGGPRGFARWAAEEGFEAEPFEPAAGAGEQRRGGEGRSFGGARGPEGGRSFGAPRRGASFGGARGGPGGRSFGAPRGGSFGGAPRGAGRKPAGGRAGAAPRTAGGRPRGPARGPSRGPRR